ncbi:MAG: hypothetical protein CVV23_15080 [Ignavibacteriae bacterium HGW-Ignavibacteriae-2]|jgi:DNA polymerase-3 subunit delta'|nr:MAG: hypothetical protein CVV23_15080 [Ignavibacteriae bacterium HGW-Ignavibacteriae-2]PKP12428.1 MAG: hypothetical protein CVU08_10595 [Bacteroidetes bacterium HGW-Bacteroidetes-3]
MAQYLDRVANQERAKTHLNKIIESNRLPHALLFSGPQGVGKHFTSVQFVKEINLKADFDNSVKKKINNLEEPFIKFIIALPRGKSETTTDSPTSKLSDGQIEEMNSELEKKKRNPYHTISVSKAQNIKISSIREIKKYLSLNFAEGKYRTIIIHEAHNMSTDSQNALLKNLEEPPEDVILILHTSQPNFLLPTIKSRCQEVTFDPLPNDMVVKILTEYYSYDSSLVQLVSRFCDGSVSKAATLLENDFEEFLEKCINILRYSLARRYSTAIGFFDEIIQKSGEEGFYTTLDFIQKWFLDVIRDKYFLDNQYFTKYSDTIKKFNSKYATENAINVINKIDSLNEMRGHNINLNICVSNVIFEIGRIGIG